MKVHQVVFLIIKVGRSRNLYYFIVISFFT